MLKLFAFAIFLAFIASGLIYRLILGLGGSKRQKNSQPTYITLEELSRLWCPERRQHSKQIQPTNPTNQPETQTKEVLSQQTAEQTSTPTKQAISQPTNAQNQQTEQTPASISFQHKQISDFWRMYIRPNLNVLHIYLPVIEQILELLDKHGDCPSVVSVEENPQDKEAKELASTYDALSKVPLLEHSLNVAREMIDICVKAGRKDYDLILGKLLIAGLGHDLGKIPALREQNVSYRTGDHAIVSYKLLQGILPDSLPDREEILNAVRDHHYQSQKELTALLRQADFKAREQEVSRISAQAALLLAEKRQKEEAEQTASQENKQSISEGNRMAYCDQLEKIDLSWLDVDQFLSEIEKTINVENEKGVFRAFSTKEGLVYIMPICVSDVIFDLAAASSRREMLVYKDDIEKRRAVEYAAVQILREKGLIPDLISEGYTGARFELTIESKDGKQIKKRGFYLPVRAEAFSTPLADLEKRKEGTKTLSKITSVKPLYGKF